MSYFPDLKVLYVRNYHDISSEMKEARQVEILASRTTMLPTASEISILCRSVGLTYGLCDSLFPSTLGCHNMKQIGTLTQHAAQMESSKPTGSTEIVTDSIQPENTSILLMRTFLHPELCAFLS